MIEGLYIHIPFCARRCHYCDFNTYEGMEGLAPEYVEALKADLRLSALEPKGLRSIFFGGGTPSLLSSAQIKDLIDSLRELTSFDTLGEISLEANPGTADLEKFEGFRSAGVNRLSFGFQAKQEKHLQALGRIHDAKQSAEAWRLARAAGFKNLSLDLMFGLPNQSMEEWQESLRWAMDFKPEHLSFYGLTIETGTRFHYLHEQGQLPLPDEDLQADMYAWGIEFLAKSGLTQYEISNFAKLGRESVHNRLYWQNRETLGIGAGAWSYRGGERFNREKNPSKYIQAISNGFVPVTERERLSDLKARAEAVYLGLRMMQGLDLEAWKRQNGSDLLHEFELPAREMMRDGFLEIVQNHLRLTPKGLPLANHVFSAFL
jgi:oxygen-independent coproporphyrinogen-3 oxidase